MTETTKQPRLCVTCAFHEKPEAKIVCRACVSKSSGKRTDPTSPDYAPNWRRAGSKPRMYMPGVSLRISEVVIAIIEKRPVFYNHKFQLHTWMEQMRFASLLKAAKDGMIFEAIEIKK